MKTKTCQALLIVVNVVLFVMYLSFRSRHGFEVGGRSVPAAHFTVQPTADSAREAVATVPEQFMPPEIRLPEKPSPTPPTTKPTRFPHSHSSKQAREKFEQQFLKDPSFSVRCPGQMLRLMNCPSPPPPVDSVELPSPEAPVTNGSTTRGMEVVKMSSIVKHTVEHHPIFREYAAASFKGPFLEQRVVEFLGCHARFEYDCLPDRDFRLYHPSRAAMCTEYERRNESFWTKKVYDQVGMFPIVDEEYFEFIMTLTIARSAAMYNRPMTFIELGARYGTWIVRAGAAYRQFSSGKYHLLGIETNCDWWWRMQEHVRCNGIANADLVLAFVAPRSYNSVKLSDPMTYSKARAISLLDFLPMYERVDMMDFDIQGFEHFSVAEEGVYELLTERVAFLHFGTHSTDIERTLISLFQEKGEWCVLYFFAGAHTKKLNHGHRCNTPYGPISYNDGALGVANLKFYGANVRKQCRNLVVGSKRKTSSMCHYIDAVETVLNPLHDFLDD